jgi:hypothetical protein
MKELLLTGLLLLGLLAPAHAQIEYLTLDKQALDLPARSFYIEQVLDGRIDRAGVGQTQEEALFGLVNTTQPIDLSPNLVAGLTNFVQAQLPARPDDRAVLLLVRELRVAEQAVSATTGPGGTTMTPAGTARQARATVALYLHTAAGYHFVKTATDTLRPRSLYGAAYGHERNIANVLQRCLAQFSAADLLAAQRQPAQTLADLARIGRITPAGGLGYAILNPAARLEPGYYPSFLAFRNNQLVPAPTLRVKTTARLSQHGDSLREITPQVMVNGKERPLPESWGFWDGQRAYIRYQGHYAALARQGDAFEFVATPKGSGSVWAGAPKPTVHTLDLVSGRATLFADAGRPNPHTDTARIYVYCPLGAGPAQTVFLNDKPVGELGENQVLKLAWADPVHEPRLRLGPAPAPELAFMPNFRQPVYVRPARKPEPGKPPLELVAPKAGEFDLKAIRLRTRK